MQLPIARAECYNIIRAVNAAFRRADALILPLPGEL
nr:MAG TPA: hypothetical protein [Caudoviricetes sp.]DAW42667.1 MAG TPA: hypothetical protein [Caudoviricetes sp.]